MKIKKSLIIALIGLTGCSNINLLTEKGNGEIETYIYNINNNITSLEVGIANHYIFNNQSSINHNVVVSCYENDMQYVEVKVDSNLKDDILVNLHREKLTIKKDSYKHISFKKIEINIYGCKFYNVELSNATDAQFNNSCLAENANLSLSGASSMTCSYINFSLINLNLSGASFATINGTSEYFFGEISGASFLDGKNFEIQEGTLSVSGASTARLNVSKSLYGSASGASKVLYSGEGSVNIDTSGASTVEKI